MAEEKYSRRAFLGGGTIAAVAGNIPSEANAQARRSRDSGLLNIGIILGGGNHAQNMWARLINAVPNENNIEYTPRRTGMVLTHVWAPLPEWSREFAGRFNVANVVDRFDGMIDEVDGLIIDTFFGTPYNHHFAKPYIEAGVPVYVNRPFADSMRKTRELTDLSIRHNTPIMTGSSFEHLESTMAARNRYPYEKVVPYDAYNATSDFYSHGVHGLLFAYACAGGNIEAVSHKTESWIQGGGVTHVFYRDRGNGPFMGRIHDFSTEHYLCAIRFGDSPQFYGFGPADWDQYMWIHLLQRIQVMFETGVMPEPHDHILEKTAMFIAAFRSIIRENGGLVSPDDLDDDWAIGPPWGHSGNPPMEEQRAYQRLFGEEKGELRPDRTFG